MHLMALGAFRPHVGDVTHFLLERLNAPCGARCFLTRRCGSWIRSRKKSLNTPYGAWCILTRPDGAVPVDTVHVLMHLMVLGAF